MFHNNLISRYIIPSMEYKLHKSAVRSKQGELLENPTTVTVKEDNQQPSLSSNTFEGSTTNSRVQTSNVEDSNANTSALPGIKGETFKLTLKKEGFNNFDISDDIV